MIRTSFMIVCIIVISVFFTVCDDTSPNDSSSKSARSLQPCDLLSDSEAVSIIGDAVDTVEKKADFDFISCHYLGEFRLGEGSTPGIFIQARTDSTILAYGSGSSAKAFWDNFYSSKVTNKTRELSPTKYYCQEDSLVGEILIEELTGVGDAALLTRLGFNKTRRRK